MCSWFALVVKFIGTRERARSFKRLECLPLVLPSIIRPPTNRWVEGKTNQNLHALRRCFPVRSFTISTDNWKSSSTEQYHLLQGAQPMPQHGFRPAHPAQQYSTEPMLTNAGPVTERSHVQPQRQPGQGQTQDYTL